MRQTQNESGFTLIEVLIAAILLAYGLIAYGSFSGGMVTQNANQDRKTLATELAREKLEDIRNQALQNTLTAANSNTAGEGVDRQGNITGAAGTGVFTRTWTIDDTNTPLLVVTVTLTWEGRGTTSTSLSTNILDT